MMTYETVVASIARNMMGNKNPVPFFIFGHTLPNLNNLSAQFMPQNKRRLFNAIPLHDIATADTAGNDLNKEFTVANLRNTNIIIYHQVSKIFSINKDNFCINSLYIFNRFPCECGGGNKNPFFSSLPS